MAKRTSTFIKVLFAFFVWSLLGPLVNLSSLTVFQTIWSISVLAAFYLIIFAIFTKTFSQLRVLQPNLRLLLFLLSSGLSGVLWIYSLTLLPIALAVLLNSTVPLLTFILGALFLNEGFQVTKFISLLLGISGVGIILLSNFSQLSLGGTFYLGVLIVLISATLTAIQAIMAKKLALHFPNWITVLLIMLSQVVITTPLAFQHQWVITPLAIGSTLFLSIFSSIIAFYFYVNAFKVLKSSTVTLAGYIEPFFAAIWGYFFLRQILSITVALGGVLILIAGYITVRYEEKNNKLGEDYLSREI